jgi:eukaryotic-like serine/threonine-protein kinase
VERVDAKPEAVQPGAPDVTERTQAAPEAPDDSVTATTLNTDPGTDTTLGGLDAGYALEPGVMLGDYRIDGKLGEGGMGVVYSAVHPLIGKRAAIKVLRKQLCADPSAVERFVNEARAVNEIGHPNIVDIFTFGETLDGRHYLVMDRLKGMTLRDRMAKGTMTPSEIEVVVRQLARALEAAHEHGIIHRDLKPENVFLVEVPDDAPLVKLLDFGIAKLAHRPRTTDDTAAGELVGTPTYISPEQARGIMVDRRTDIYALGVILFELVARRTPFLAATPVEMVVQHLTTEAPLLSDVKSPVSPALDRIVHAMLAKEPDERPTLAQVRAAIASVSRETSRERVVTRLTIPAASAERPRHRTATAVGSAVLFVIAAAIAVTIAFPRPTDNVDRAPPVPSPAPTAVPPREPPPVAPAPIATSQAEVPTAIATSRAAAPSPIATSTRAADPATIARIASAPPTKSVAPSASDKVIKHANKSAQLELVVTGTDAPQIRVDGVWTSLAANGTLELSPGNHTIAVTAPNMTTRELRVALDPGQTVKRAIQLERLPPPPPPDDDHLLMRAGELSPNGAR